MDFILSRKIWLGLIAGFFFSVGQVIAACPSGSRFTVRNHINKDISMSLRDLSIDQGAYSATLDLAFPQTNLIFSLNSAGLLSSTTTIPIRNRVWRLRVPRNSGISINDLKVSYRVTARDGALGKLSSVFGSNSQLDLTIISQKIDQTVKKNEIRFDGFIGINVDFSNIKRSGKYTGTITTIVDCN